MEHRNNRKGLTVIDLITIIVIVAIIAAMLSPVLAKSDDRAWQCACQSRLKQLSIGIMLFMQDHDDTMPRLNTRSSVPDKWTYWYQDVYPYVKSTEVFKCPSDTTNDTIARDMLPDNVWMDAKGNTLVKGLSYVFSYTASGVAAKDIRTPKDMFIMWDSLEPWADFATDAKNNCFRASRHNGGCNYAFVDGHVKWFKTESVPNTDKRFTLH